jgi:hypothetical protein
MKTASRKNLFILSFTLLVVMLGYGIVMPIMPFFIGSGLAFLVLLLVIFLLPESKPAPLPTQRNSLSLNDISILFAREYCQYLFGFHNPAIGLQRGEERLLDVIRRDGCISKLEIARGTGILGHDDLEAKVGGSPGGGIHAHVGHHAAYDDALGLPALQKLEQVGVQEGVRLMLVDNRLAFEMGDPIVDVRAAVTGNKECRVRLPGDVLDVDMMPAMLAEALQEHVGLLGGLHWVYKWILSPGEIILLDIDHDQSGFHLLSV